MILNESRVVVTGGAGFIGSHLVDRLLDLDNEVIVLDNFSSGSRDNLEKHQENKRLRIALVDIRDENTVYDVFEKVDYVFHLACLGVRQSLRTPTDVHEVNITGTLNALKAAVRAGVKRFLYVSSSEVYGTADRIPMPEDDNFRPETIYGSSKLAGEYYTQVFQRSGWLETVIARPHNNYGPREHYDGLHGEVIPRFILQTLAGKPLTVYGDGRQTRDFTYVTETAEYMIRIMEADRAVGQTFNVCRGEEVSVGQLAELIIDIIGGDSKPQPAPGRPSGVLKLCGDASKLRRLLGDAPRISIREGLTHTIEWFKQHIKITPELVKSLTVRNWEACPPEPWLEILERRKEGAFEALPQKNIPLARPFLGRPEAEAAGKAIYSGWVTQGPRVQAFEEAFSQYVGAPHACATSSGTTALHLALRAVGVEPGDVVITVSHSFIATANAIRYCQAEPYFVDIDPTTLNMDPDLLKKAIEEDFEEKDGAWWIKDGVRLAVEESPLTWIRPDRSRLSAILVVHQVGMPADLGRILALAQAYGLPVVEDAACAAGSLVRLESNGHWDKIGRSHGAAACFSFHPRKMITTGDGGMVTTNHAEYDEKFRLWRHHGMSISPIVRHTSRKVMVEEYETTGYNYRLTDIQAAVGLEQLRRLDDFIQRRKELVEVYRERFQEIPWLDLPGEPDYGRTNWQSFWGWVKPGAPLSRNEIVQHLLDHQIVTKTGVMNAHEEKPYPGRFALPVSEAAKRETIFFPLYHALPPEAIGRMAGLLKKL